MYPSWSHAKKAMSRSRVMDVRCWAFARCLEEHPFDGLRQGEVYSEHCGILSAVEFRQTLNSIPSMGKQRFFDAREEGDKVVSGFLRPLTETT